MNALHELLDMGDVFEVGRQRYLVAPVNDALLEEIAAALGAVEDDEDNGDLEPSIGAYNDGEAALGWANEGPQSRLTGCDDEAEASLGWSGGLQYRLDAAVDDLESDGNCDAEANGDEREPKR